MRVGWARGAAVVAAPAGTACPRSTRLAIGVGVHAPAVQHPSAAWALRARTLATKAGVEDENNAVAVNNSLTVVEQAEWEQKWKKFKESAYQSRIFEHVNAAGERIDDFIEDSDNFFVRLIRKAFL